jgi:xanthine dehydrogenase YagT iron-sulfur-binding subunit
MRAWHRNRECRGERALVSLKAESTMRYTINGKPVQAEVDVRMSLLDLLRDHLQLTGTKKGCDQGACGACTVLVDGDRINSCLALAVQYQGREITTIEGVGSPADLHRLQAAFVEHDGFQCGYCTPGQICSAIGIAAELKRGVPSALTEDLLIEEIDLSQDEIRERMSGNLCRCGAYNGIVDAVHQTFARKTTNIFAKDAAE